MYKNLLNKSVIFGLALAASGTVVAQGTDTVICNDCNAAKIEQLVNQHTDNNLYVVDFVNATAQKVSQGQTVKLSVSELNSLNNKYDYRKTPLRAVR
ncbi:hypothetical protein [Shewanella sp. GXUN23E]|uniref:hypothetical protein n=1 Tax=Shewanella sp. GXUN23E TaxID=3422498 RepID=UPI003D7F0C70